MRHRGLAWFLQGDLMRVYAALLWILFGQNLLPGSTVIDVIVAYDIHHQARWGDEGMLEETESILNYVEGVFQRGSIDVEFHIVHIFCDPTYSCCGEAYTHFFSRRFDYTTAFGADLFIFFANNGAWNPLGQADVPSNFCTANIQYFNGMDYYHLVAHEIGHTFGCGHETGGTGKALYPYSHAYLWNTDGSPFWTIMADGSLGNGYRIPYFSNPDLTYGQHPIGVKYRNRNGQPNPDCADNNRTIREYLPYAAKRESQQNYLWRDSAVLPNGNHWLEWFGCINLADWQQVRYSGNTPGRYLYHQFLGWCWFPSTASTTRLWLWSHRFEAWVYATADLGRTAWIADGTTGWLQW